MGCTGCSYSASGPGIPNNNYACSFVAGLPIELVSFTGNCNSKSVSLNWTTASEINNDYFTIERAQDAINFKELRKFDGAANNNQTINYSFIDTEPLTGTSYYRLKQTDFDGQFNYFNTIAVTCQDKIGEISSQRLDVLVDTQDGFKIAEKDLEIRGPGEIMGAQQTGIVPMKYTNLVRDSQYLMGTKKVAEVICDEDPELANQLIERWISGSIAFADA